MDRWELVIKYQKLRLGFHGNDFTNSIMNIWDPLFIKSAFFPRITKSNENPKQGKTKIESKKLITSPCSQKSFIKERINECQRESIISRDIIKRDCHQHSCLIKVITLAKIKKINPTD